MSLCVVITITCILSPFVYLFSAGCFCLWAYVYDYSVPISFLLTFTIVSPNTCLTADTLKLPLASGSLPNDLVSIIDHNSRQAVDGDEGNCADECTRLASNVLLSLLMTGQCLWSVARSCVHFSSCLVMLLSSLSVCLLRTAVFLSVIFTVN